jgi:hypothetical protein
MDNKLKGVSDFLTREDFWKCYEYMFDIPEQVLIDGIKHNTHQALDGRVDCAPTPEDIEFNLLESRLELVNSDKLSDTLATPTTPVTEAPIASDTVELQDYLDVYQECKLYQVITLADYLISLGYHNRSTI